MASRRPKMPPDAVDLREKLIAAGLAPHFADLLDQMPSRTMIVEGRRQFREVGAARDEVMFVRSGLLAKFKTDCSGRRQIVALRFPGEGILPRGGHADYGIQATVRSEVMVGAAADFDPIVDAHPGEIWNRRKSGDVFPEWLAISTVRDESGDVTHYVGMLIDISERKLAEDYMLHLAQHDALTELPNRLLFLDRLRQSFARAKMKHVKVALLFMDIDRFKTINDSLGHHVGDQLLQEVARRLKRCIEGVNTIARLGGDEFVIVLEQVRSIQDVGHVASRIISAMREPVIVGEFTLGITVSIGIGIYPEDGEDVIALMKSADAAMYHAKEMGRNNYQFFTAVMNARIAEQVLVETHLRRAMDNGELSLHYQAQVHLESGRVQGVEALLRWTNPELGTESPSQFIPVAEESGMIIPIGNWMLRSVCEQMRRWEDDDIRGVRVGVNLSPLQFRQTDFVENLERLIAEIDIWPGQLELEITKVPFQWNF